VPAVNILGKDVIGSLWCLCKHFLNSQRDIRTFLQNLLWLQRFHPIDALWNFRIIWIRAAVAGRGGVFADVWPSTLYFRQKRRPSSKGQAPCALPYILYGHQPVVKSEVIAGLVPLTRQHFRVWDVLEGVAALGLQHRQRW